MARKKIPDDKKKKELSITIDNKLHEFLMKYIEDIGSDNRSKYIEMLIRKDMEEKGENIDREF
jgi:metal-responsive CopG/Arc/MetJ family transcriptional regulator